MKSNDLKIIFMGTPDFAVGILKHILENNFNVVAVITAPDKPAGRGQKTATSAVKDFALQKNLPILQPTNLKSPEFIEELASYQANLQIVVAFRMLPEMVWKMPKLGTFNLHASLLPQYRGAAPINWAIINGETKTGVTTFFIDDKIDTGAIILSDEITIEPNENLGQLHDKLMILGAETVIKTLHLIENNQVNTTLQPNNALLKTAHKLNKDNCKINWNNPGLKIYNHIRGLNPYPAAWTNLNYNGEVIAVKIYDAFFEETEQNQPTGSLILSKKEIKVAVTNGYLTIKTMQLPGKKKLTASEILNGNNLNETSFFN